MRFKQYTNMSVEILIVKELPFMREDIFYFFLQDQLSVYI